MLINRKIPLPMAGKKKRIAPSVAQAQRSGFPLTVLRAEMGPFDDVYFGIVPAR
jgi:hypothetical protein